MRYCRVMQDDVAVWAEVEDRDGVPWAVRAREPMPEDAAAGWAWAQGGVERGFEARPLHALESAGRLLAPVLPSKIVCIGRNYRFMHRARTARVRG